MPADTPSYTDDPHTDGPHTDDLDDSTLDKLLSALKPKRIQAHPDWQKLREFPLPARITFYYEDKNGKESYWQDMRIIKLDLKRMLLILEGAHGDPLNYDLFKITHCKNASNGEKVQEFIFELQRLWHETFEESK